jgi:hypothetical protein
MAALGQGAGERKRRSPAYPIMALGDALERLEAFDAHFARSEVRSSEVGNAWGITSRTYSNRIAAALRYYGLFIYKGVGKNRQIRVSNEGRKYLAAQQEEIKREVIHAAALRPAALAKFWGKWGRHRPENAACLDELVLNDGFTNGAAREFLKIYDATIGFANLGEADSARVASALDAPKRKKSGERPEIQHKKEPSAEDRGERELTAGILSKDSNFRIMVRGPVGVKEIDRLIAKLRLDQEILAERHGRYPSNRDDSTGLLRFASVAAKGPKP